MFTNASFRENAKLTFSQCGEDAIFSFIAFALKLKKPSYIDIGAYDPFELSNTARMYLEGSRGINIEPNPDRYENFIKHRKFDTNLNIGVSNKTGVLKYYIMDAPTLNTFSEKTASEYEEKHHRKIIKTLDIPVDTLDNIIKKYANNQFPDIMSLDVEGTEMDVLERLDFMASKPKVVCLETGIYTEAGIPEHEKGTTDFLHSKGYFTYATNQTNKILVHKDCLDSN